MLTLAWRNVWRNKRRSAITVASIACGLAAIMFGQSMIKSIQVQLVEKATGIIIGHVRVMAPDNDDPKIPDKPIKETARVLKALSEAPDLAALTARGAALCERRPLYPGLPAFPTFAREGA